MNQQPSSPSPLFAQMLEENSTRSLQWLRAADYMPDPRERCYCLERAFALDPTDTTAQSELLRLKLELCSREQVAPTPLSMPPSILRLIHSFSAILTLTMGK